MNACTERRAGLGCVLDTHGPGADHYDLDNAIYWHTLTEQWTRDREAEEMERAWDAERGANDCD